MEKIILKTPFLHQAKVFTFVENSLLWHNIKQYGNVSDDDDEDSKRKKYLIVEREGAAMFFEKKCQKIEKMEKKKE